MNDDIVITSPMTRMCEAADSTRMERTILIESRYHAFQVFDWISRQ
jgi:hypothetical protein